METHLNQSRMPDLRNLDEWTLSVYENLELSQRTRRPPNDELIERLNHLASKPPFCWVYKMRDHLPRL